MAHPHLLWRVQEAWAPNAKDFYAYSFPVLSRSGLAKSALHDG